MSISRISSTGSVNRDTPSSGHEQIARTEQAKPQRNEKVDQVAKLYEKQFLTEMFKAMRQTVKPTDDPSMAQRIYQDQLDDQYVDAWGENGGIGLSDMIYNQIMEKYFGVQTAENFKQQGPVALSNRDIVKVARVNNPAQQQEVRGAQVPLRVEVKPSASTTQVQSPWDAEVVQSSKLEGGKTAITLEHGQGLRSTLVFDGVPSTDAQIGKKLSRGQTVGVLAPESKSFLWNLNQPASAREPAAGPTSKEQDP